MTGAKAVKREFNAEESAKLDPTKVVRTVRGTNLVDRPNRNPSRGGDLFDAETRRSLKAGKEPANGVLKRRGRGPTRHTRQSIHDNEADKRFFQTQQANELARRISLAISRRGYTQAMVAEASGVATGALSQFLNRVRREPNAPPPLLGLQTLTRVSVALGVPVWSMVHPDPAVLELFLSIDDRLLDQDRGVTSSAELMATAMAVVSELHGPLAAAGGPRKPSEKPPPRRVAVR